MPKVSAGEAAPNLGVVLAAADDGQVEPPEVLGELSANTQRAGEGFEVESVLWAGRRSVKSLRPR